MFLWFFMFAIYIDLCFIYNIFISSHTHEDTHSLLVGDGIRLLAVKCNLLFTSFFSFRFRFALSLDLPAVWPKLYWNCFFSFIVYAFSGLTQGQYRPRPRPRQDTTLEWTIERDSQKHSLPPSCVRPHGAALQLLLWQFLIICRILYVLAFSAYFL